MPFENGEKRREKAANPREDDSGGDHLEWYLREYEETMNKFEEPAPRKLSEEPMVLIDGFGGKVTEAEKEKARKLDKEEPEWFILHGGHTAIHESQETTKVATNSGVSTEASKMEERKKDADEGIQSTNGQAQFSQTSAADPRREVGRGGRKAERGREAVGEQQQTSEQQQHGKTEPTQRGEMPLTERQHSNNTDMREQGETTDSAKTRGDGDTSSRTKMEHPNGPDRATAERATDATELSRIRVYDAWVIGAGELVTEWRRSLGLNQYELAHKLGHVRQSISYWENNRIPVPLENLQQLSHIVGKDLEQALRELESSGNRNVAIEWKGAIYNADAFMESIRNHRATLNRSETSRLYYLELSPLANVEFHRGDTLITLLEKDGVQAIAELRATGVRALIKKTVVERMGIDLGDKLSIRVSSVRSPEDPPWKQSIPVTPTMVDGKNRIQLSEKFEKQGLRVREGDYAKMVIQTDRGEGLVIGRIEDGAVTFSKSTTDELLGRGCEEIGSLRVKMSSVVLSPRLFRGKEELTVRVKGAVHVRGLLSTEGFTLAPPKGEEIMKATVITERGSREGESTRRLSMRVWGIDGDVYPPFSTTGEGTKLKLKTDDIVILKPEKSEALRDQDRRTSRDGTFHPSEKSIVGRGLFDAFTKHTDAETLYQVENPNQRGIDRIIERHGRIILVEEKAEHEHGREWRNIATLNQIIGYKNGFRELVESDPNLTDRLRGREPYALEIWTTAKIPKDQNGEIDLSEIRLYDPHLRRTLEEGETATFRVPRVELDGKVQYCLCHNVPHRVSVSENDIIFSVPTESTKLDDGREITLLSEESPKWLEIRVRHYDHVKSACENARLFDDGIRKDLNEKLNRIGRRW